jgi:hypothetical protein
VSYHSERDVVYSDLPSPHLVDAVEPGTTTTQWLVRHFGEPSTVTSERDQTVWQYHRVTESAKKFRALPLLAVNLRDQHRVSYNFAIEDERVARYWVSED